MRERANDEQKLDAESEDERTKPNSCERARLSQPKDVADECRLETGWDLCGRIGNDEPDRIIR